MDSMPTLGLLTGSNASVAYVGLMLWLILTISHWKMFTKAGEKGWKSLIPGYSDYTLFKLTWSPRMFWAYLASFVIMVVAMAFSGQYGISEAGQLYMTSGGNQMLNILSYVASMVFLGIMMFMSMKTSLAYSKPAIFGLGLLMVPIVFNLILAFGKATYRGPQL